jgi:DNA-binding transcriptional ArsR family regulator
MGIRIHLSADDLAEVRFAFSPTWELVMSAFKTLRDPAKHALHLPWVTEARRHLVGRDLELFFSLTSTEHYVADFLTPPPKTPFPEFEEELVRVVSTSVEQIRHEIVGICDTSVTAMASLRYLADDPASWLPTLGEQMREYWKIAIEPHWPRIRALLEGDVMYRARQLALGGADLLFGDLHPAVSYADGVVEVDKLHDEDVRPEGRGLILIPGVFDWPGVAILFGHGYQPTLSYSPRGIANLWEGAAPEQTGAMDELIGGTRADILRALDVPMTTSEIAQRLHLTPAAVSQQLGLLRRAGVVEATRQGRGVYSALSDQGRRLLELLG